METSGFKITSGKGFHVQFDNGFCISVQFGYGNYCHGRNTPENDKIDRESRNAEIMIWKAGDPDSDNDQKYMKRFGKGIITGAGKCDSVAGYVTPERVALIMARIAKAEAV